MTDKLSISNLMAQVDLKNRNFYDELDDKEKKSFSAYLCMRYAASVDGNADLQEWHIRTTNERVNTNLFDLAKHPKLQWLCCTTVGLGMGRQRHYWQGSKKKDAGSNKPKKFLAKIYPHYKEDELKLLAEITPIKELKTLARDMGMSDSEIKKELG